MKDELLQNTIHTIDEKSWEETLAKAQLSLQMEVVQELYTANDHHNGSKYGVEKGQLIGIDNVVAIMLYTNFDDLQRKFSQTFRAINQDDTDMTITERHCKSFYWFGRSLFVAITYYG